MEPITLEMEIEVVAGIIIPIIAASSFMVRYFWKKEKRDILINQKVIYLYEKEEKSHDTHKEFYDEIDDIKNRITALESKMKLLLNHFGINFKKE